MYESLRHQTPSGGMMDAGREKEEVFGGEIKGGERERWRVRDGRLVRETNNPDCKSHSLWSPRTDQERWMNRLMDEMGGRS